MWKGILHASVWLGGCSRKCRILSESCDGWDEVAVPCIKSFMISEFDMMYTTCLFDACPILY